MDLSFLSDFANDVQTAVGAASSVVDLGQKAGLISAPTNYGPSVPPILPGQSPALPWSDYVTLGTTPFGSNYSSSFNTPSPLQSNVPYPPPQPNVDSSKLGNISSLVLILGIGVVVLLLAK